MVNEGGAEMRQHLSGDKVIAGRIDGNPVGVGELETVVHEDKSESVPLHALQTAVRGYIGSGRKGIAGIADLDGAVTRAASTSLSRNEGQDRGDRGKSRQLLGEEHISAVSITVGIVLEYYGRGGGGRGSDLRALIVAEVRRRNDETG
jgi:hypothetical protein